MKRIFFSLFLLYLITEDVCGKDFLSVVRQSTPQIVTESKLILGEDSNKYFTINYQADSKNLWEYVDITVVKEEAGSCEIVYLLIIKEAGRPEEFKRLRGVARVSTDKEAAIDIGGAGRFVFKLSNKS